MKPAEEEQKKFWEWCGLQYMETTPDWALKAGYGSDMGWIDSDGFWVDHKTPPIDLNNLFKYAVPKYIELDSSGDSPNNIDNAYRRLFERWLKRLHWDNWQNPALALFWAIYKVIEQ